MRLLTFGALFTLPLQLDAVVLLSWDFAGDAGDAASVTADSIHASLGANSGILSRGAGLTASANADRFNATNWAVTSIANAVTGNDYMEFSLNYNGTNTISVDTLNFIWQRSATGTTGLAIRSSLDSFASDLATFSVVDNTSSQTFATSDLGVAFEGLTSNITFRFYGFSEAASGTAGFEGSGADLVVNGVMGAAEGSSLFWVGADTTRGGSGTWSAAGTTWSATDADGQTAAASDKTKTAVFGGATAAAVNVSGTVEADAGISFNTTGYTLSGGTAIEMNGANATINAITVDTGVTATIGTDITGSTGVGKTGAGTLVLNSAKSYTGGTTITTGTLQLGDGTTNGSVAGNITNNASLAFNNGVAQTFAGDISGTGALTKSGAEVLTLTGTNTFAGKTTITAGFVAASGEAKFGANPGAFTADQISLNGGGIQSNGNINFSSNRGLTLAAGGGTFNSVGSDVITLTNVVTGSGALTKTGAGELQIDGANTFTGGLVINDGRVKLGNAGALNSSSPNSVSFGAGATAAAVLEINGNSLTISGLNTHATPGVPVVENANGTSATLTVSNSTANTYAGTMQNGTGAGTLALTKSGAGALTLSGNNSYTGGTTLSAGSIVAAHNNALGSGGVLATGGSLFAASGTTLSNDIDVAAVALGQLMITQYYEGTGTSKWIEISNIGAASIDLASGGYRVGHYNNASAEGYKTDIAPNFTMALTGSLAAGQSLLLGNTGNAALYASSHTPLLNDNSVINFNGNDSIVLYTTSTFATANIVDAIGFTNTGNEGADKAFVRTATTTGYNTVSGSDVLDFSSSWTQVTNATVDGATAGTDNRLGYTSLTGGSVASVTLGSVTSGASTFSGQVTLSSDATLSAVAASTVSFSGVIKDGSNGAKGITKTGAGTVVLSGSNTYTGSTILNDGNLQVGLSGSGKTGTGNVTVDGSGAVLSGSGTVDGSSTSVILGVVKPGDSGGTLTGTLNTKTLIFTPASSTTVAELQILGSTAGSNLSADKINITGDLTLNSFSNLFVNGSGYTAAVGDAFTIIDWSGLLTLNSFSTGSNMRTGNNDDANEENLDLPNISGIGLWDITNFSSGGALTLTVVAVPEPTRGMLMLLGSMLLIFRRRRING
jgi:fibronectin-binding autotransporter adhesin